MHSTTIETPVGPFTIVGRGKAVLASGFTTDEAELTALIPRKTLEAGPTEDDGTDLQPAIDAARAYFDGDLAAIDTVEVEQHGAGAFLDHAWDVLRTVTAGDDRDVQRVRRTGRSAGRDSSRGQRLREKCRRAVRAVPPDRTDRRQPRWLPLRPGHQALAARP